MDVVEIPIDRLVPYARNPRRNDEAVAAVAASLAEFGWRQPIVVDEAMVIVAGHTRYAAAQRLGLTRVPVHVARGLTPAQVRAYRLMDNRAHQNARWDEDLLRLELEDLKLEAFNLNLTGFDDDELGRLLASLADSGEPAPDVDESNNDGLDEAADAAPAPPAEPVTRPGDLWHLGEHRLLCGDSTDAAAVARLLDGERAALLFTSPPYANQRAYTTGGIADWDALMQGVFGHLDAITAADGQVLVNLGLVHRDGEWQPYWRGWLAWMRQTGWRRFGLYVWDQGPGMPGDWNGRLAPAFELLFHFNRKPRKPNKIVPCRHAGQETHLRADGSSTALRQKDGTVGAWCHAGRPTQDRRIPDSVIRIMRHKGAIGRGLDHPAPFPVKLPAFLLEAYSDAGALVYEPFAGSGSTIIAGEQTGRRVRAIELAPTYVDVAIQRWQQLFLGAPVMLADGRRFEAVAAARGVELAT